MLPRLLTTWGAVQAIGTQPGLWPGGGGNIEKNERIGKEWIRVRLG